MSTRFSGKSMKSLVDYLKNQGIIMTEKVYNSMLQVDRKDFTTKNHYEDCPQLIDNYNTTISAPHMHAFTLEYLSPYLNEGDKVLDIGSGSGYLTLALSKIMNDKGTVIGVDHIKGLCQYGLSNIMKNHKNVVYNGHVKFICTDGRKGLSDYAPYKCIHVGGSVESIPQELIDQLAEGGRMFIVAGSNDNQSAYLVDKDKYGNVYYQKPLSVRYASLTTVKEQLHTEDDEDDEK